jgi:hypothetical protein
MTVPSRAGNGSCDGREATKGLAIPLEALFNDHDLVSAALPFTNESRAGLEHGLRPDAADTASGLQFLR